MLKCKEIHVHWQIVTQSRSLQQITTNSYGGLGDAEQHPPGTYEEGIKMMESGFSNQGIEGE